MHAILSRSVGASEVHPPNESANASSLARDHFVRVIRALRGFAVFGFSWLRPWLSYALWPMLKRCWPQKLIRFTNFHVRANACDLETFGGIFEDYRVGLVRRALRDVELVVDLGANVGAFSCLVDGLWTKQSIDRKIVAVEPSADALAILRTQPFASRLEILPVAVGAQSATGRVIRGSNSVSHHVDLSGSAGGESVKVVTLWSLCDRPSLVKMDIEGAECEILQAGIPDSVRHLFLEWHPRPNGALKPPDLIPGKWRLLSRDPYGASTWHFHR